MEYLDDINFFVVVVSAFIFIFLGLFVYFSNKKSATNRAFLFFTVIEVIWNLINYLSYQFYLSYYIIWLARIAIFFAVWHVFLIFNFIYIFPKEKAEFNKNYKFILLPFVAIISVINLTPFVFSGIKILADGKTRVVNGPGIILFGATAIGLVITGIIILIKRTAKTQGLEKKQFKSILIGISITFILHVIFNFIFPAFLNDLRFIPMGGIFGLPFLFLTMYAIFKHKLFNIKVLAVQALTFAIWITLLIRIFISDNQTDKIVGSFIFFATLIFGIMLIKSVSNEIKMRERIETLYADLKTADEKLKKIDEEKSEFLFITSHQLRTPMTIIKGYISMMLEGDFGDLDLKLKHIINKIYISNERLVKIINDLLDLSRIERGKMDYDFKENSFLKIILESISELKPNLKDKKLKLIFKKPKKELSNVLIDEDYTRQVIVNLIDNAIKYTNKDKSEIKIKLEEHNGIIRFSIKDEGQGISEDAMPHLFKRYSREEKTYSKASRGMGLGLYIAKRIVEDQHGKIWAESKGEGHGSTFFVELPVAG